MGKTTLLGIDSDLSVQDDKQIHNEWLKLKDSLAQKEFIVEEFGAEITVNDILLPYIEACAQPISYIVFQKGNKTVNFYKTSDGYFKMEYDLNDENILVFTQLKEKKSIELYFRELFQEFILDKAVKKELKFDIALETFEDALVVHNSKQKDKNLQQFIDVILKHDKSRGLNYSIFITNLQNGFTQQILFLKNNNELWAITLNFTDDKIVEISIIDTDDLNDILKNKILDAFFTTDEESI